MGAGAAMSAAAGRQELIVPMRMADRTGGPFERACLSFPSCQPGARNVAGAGRQDAGRFEFLAHCGEGGFMTRKVRHIARRSDTADLGRDPSRQLPVDVQDTGPRTPNGERPRRRLARSRRSPGNNRRLSVDIHGELAR